VAHEVTVDVVVTLIFSQDFILIQVHLLAKEATYTGSEHPFESQIAPVTQHPPDVPSTAVAQQKAPVLAQHHPPLACVQQVPQFGQ
jgi:hypothetical protein